MPMDENRCGYLSIPSSTIPEQPRCELAWYEKAAAIFNSKSLKSIATNFYSPFGKLKVTRLLREIFIHDILK
jgi:hypothetical protein